MDELYIVARRVLLDALEALGPHLDAAILVGAQAIYLHTGSAEIAIAEYTTDADLALDPARLDEIPPLEQALTEAGFQPMGAKGVGVWKTKQRLLNTQEIDVQVDFLVPSTVSPGAGRRAARLPGHHSNAARKVDGLEGVLIDPVRMEIGSLEPDFDTRSISMHVARPGALLVAKLFKIHERHGSERANDKDALDVLRLLQATPTVSLAASIKKIMADERSAIVGARSLILLDQLFGNRAADGSSMAARATQPLMDPDQIRLSCALLAVDLLSAINRV